MADILINKNILTEVSNALTDTQCVVLCLQNEACVSVFHRRQRRRCQLHDVLFLSPQDGEEEAGTVYYSVRTGDCPSGYVHNRLLNFCYQLHTDQKKYNVSVADCRSRGEYLAVIDSEEKQNHVTKQIQSSSDTNVSSYFIDGSDAAEEGQWVFHDGRKLTYKAWAPGYPLHGTGRNYIVSIKSDNFRWHNSKVAKHDKYYICEKNMLNPLPIE
ncbi:type-2 ice-structuring protein-like [Haliotis asinina]|uniref:type-2 ice-structuring protein-like n=1 Tax=Haliotis asinina TaxID=109174 RepID=UPI0035324524